MGARQRSEQPLGLDDLTALVEAVGDKLDVIMIPKVEGAWDIHFVDQYLALLEAKYGVTKPISIHALLETAQGVKNVEDIAGASPRMHGMSLGPADLAASRGMKTTRVGGGHPFYGVLADAKEGAEHRAFFQQDLWHYTVARMVDACVSYGIRAFYGPFGDLKDEAACEAQFRNAFHGLCRGLVVSSEPNLDRQTCFQPAGGRSDVRQADSGSHARRHGRRHHRWQDAR